MTLLGEAGLRALAGDQPCRRGAPRPSGWRRCRASSWSTTASSTSSRSKLPKEARPVVRDAGRPRHPGGRVARAALSGRGEPRERPGRRGHRDHHRRRMSRRWPPRSRRCWHERSTRAAGARPRPMRGDSGAAPTFTGNRALMLEEAADLRDRLDRDDRRRFRRSPPRCTSRLGGLARTAPIGLPGLSEPETVRHYTRLSRQNYAIDLGPVPARLLHDEAQSAAQREGRAAARLRRRPSARSRSTPCRARSR